MIEAAKKNDSGLPRLDDDCATIPPPASGDAYSAETVVREAPPEILDLIRQVHGQKPPESRRAPAKSGMRPVVASPLVPNDGMMPPRPTPRSAPPPMLELPPPPPPVLEPAPAPSTLAEPLVARAVPPPDVSTPSLSSKRLFLAAAILAGMLASAATVLFDGWP
jgi:hypothetical protein